VKGGWKVKQDESNSGGKCSDENGHDNVNSDGDADSDANKVVQPKNQTQRLVEKTRRKMEK